MKFRKYRKEIVLFLDFSILVLVGLVLYTVFNHQVEFGNQPSLQLFHRLCLMILCGAATQFLYRTYDSLWRYAQSMEYLMLLLAGVTGYFLYVIMEMIIPGMGSFGLYSLCVYAVTLLGMLFMRLMFRQYRKRLTRKKVRDRIPVAIIGAGEAGVKLVEELQSNPKSPYYPVCFIDDSPEKIGKRIHNIIIKGPISYLHQFLTVYSIREIVIAIPSISPEKQKEILDIGAKLNCRVRILPDNLLFLEEKKEGKLWSNVREIQLCELLGREPITIDTKEMNQNLFNKVVLVTGGGGTIGSELCRQIAKAKPKKLIILDNYENNAYEIQQELLRRYKNTLSHTIEIASIRDREKMFQIFEKYRPQIVFHAAAHKHVPLMEDCPDEAIRNNVFGTYNLVMAADYYGVERFVLISTDKAVNPTNIMGASKRLCEMILQSMKDISNTEFVAVRFGNVLGSNGSVIPLFQKQIAEGGPITITDKRIVRYFMTITEAVQLVLEAGAMANKSEIYVLDMGKPVRILELAENLIRLSGLEPYVDIMIVETGLRPGEKLYEEMLLKNDGLIATKNHKIFIEQQEMISQDTIQQYFAILNKALASKSSCAVKTALKQIVITYKDPEEVNGAITREQIK